MSKALACLCAALLGATFAAPASAQIILGGEPVATPGQPEPVQLPFPRDASAADYVAVSVAAPTFVGDTPAEAEIAAKITEAVRANLASVGVFTAPDSAAISAFSSGVNVMPVWADWNGAGANALLVGKAVIGAGDTISVQFRLHDVGNRKQLLGTQYTLPSTTLWQRAANKVADDVMVALVGGKSGFDSKLSFVVEVGGETQLWTMGQDGTGGEALISKVGGLQAPRYAPDGQRFIYSADAPIPGKPNQAQRTTILYDLATGRREPLFTGTQPNADARFSPDGRSLIYSRKDGANTDIFIRGVASNSPEKRLTDDKASDTQPTLSPDATKFAFISDRAGGQAVYVANADGAPLTCADGAQAKVCRLTTEAGEYLGLAWSPVGDWISFSRKTGDQAAIHVIRSDGSGARALTTPGGKELDMHPTWSPDGRRIAFSRVTGSRAALNIVTVASGTVRKIDVPGDVYEPDWSSKLP